MTATLRDAPSRPGFTLIELLLTIAILGILAAIVLLAINPRKQLEDAHDARRRTDLNTILNAVNQFQIREGRLPLFLEEDAIPLGEDNRKDICVSESPLACVLGNKAILNELIEVEYDYLTAIPQDPKNADPAGSGYEIWRDENGRIHVRAPNYKNGAGHTVAR